MEEVILEVEKRTDIGTGRVNRLRKAAGLPAVVYGEGQSPINLQLSAKEFAGIVAGHKGGSFMIKLRIKDGSKREDKAVLIKEIQHHPVKDNVIHVDFNEISLTKNIRVKVPVAAKGEAIGVKRDAGVLDHVIWELEIECLPASIPEVIEVDVSNLQIGQSIHVKDVVVPAGVKVLNDPEAAVLAVAAPTKEEAALPAEAAEGQAKLEPEVIKEKKEKVEGETASAPAGKKG
ncbi:MAG TPA: 50S ribosomal protein L25 [Candidatus Omnitrophota bacterium]|nr:50S ribosomal protein L25 [Candidatus Omnitrophota bacterium]